MFDQKAFDAGRVVEEPQSSEPVRTPEPEKELPVEETRHGDIPSILLAFEPENVKKLANTRFTGVLVNDSNYYIDFTFLKRSSEDRGWELVFNGTVNPNELIDLVVLTHEELPDYGKVALQGVAYKKDKVFSIIPPLNVTRKLDLTKFHKFHCFHQSKYFDTPVIEFPLVAAGDSVTQLEIDPQKLEEGIKSVPDKNLAKELGKKYKVGSNHENQGSSRQDNPFKKLPLIEVDLHIGELTDTLAGMEAKDMLELQLGEVRKTMNAHSRRKGQKIVFIHGKGEGVLRKAVLELLKKEYPKAELQDASFREYGFGATLVTIH